MNKAFFIDQVQRLKRRFGEKPFDTEFIKLAAQEVVSVSDDYFQKQIDIWIGNRKAHDAPLLTEFRECRLAFEKNILERDARGASRALSAPAAYGGLKTILKEQFGGANSAVDAIEMITMKNKLGRASEETKNTRPEIVREADRKPNPGLAEEQEDFVF